MGNGVPCLKSVRWAMYATSLSLSLSRSAELIIGLASGCCLVLLLLFLTVWLHCHGECQRQGYQKVATSNGDRDNGLNLTGMLSKERPWDLRVI